MKFRFLALFTSVILLFACPLQPPPADQPPPRVSFDSLTKIGNAVADKGSSAARSGIPRTLGEGETIYLSGLTGTTEVLFQIKGSAGGEIQRNCVFDGQVKPPSGFPSAFSYNGESYLLFSITNDFILYKYGSEDEATVSFSRSSIWDLSAISSWIKSLMYRGTNNAWATNPDYSDARKTLYFTLLRWEENAYKGDFIRVRVYESKLVDGAFQVPTEVKGAIDPYDPSHYVDGQRHTVNDFPGLMGIGWIGRLYVTEDGTRAFYNCLTVSFTSSCTIMKSDDPYIFPTPNCQDPGTSDITDIYDSRLIYTTAYQADIDSEGNFNNIQLLPPSVNQGGINFVSDISPDGSKLYVSHMEVDDDFWAYWWGPDGLALQLCQSAPYSVEPWRGYIIEYSNPGWTVLGTRGESTVSGHSAAYLSEEAKYNSFNEAEFRASRPWFPSTSTVTPTFIHGRFSYNIEDHPDMTFVDDPQVLGVWNVVDFVADIDAFNPAAQSFAGGYWWTGAWFQSAGACQTKFAGQADWSFGGAWTRGILYWNPMAQAYAIRSLGGADYLFVEWKSGDYSIRGMKPPYYVFKRQ